MPCRAGHKFRRIPDSATLALLGESRQGCRSPFWQTLAATGGARQPIAIAAAVIKGCIFFGVVFPISFVHESNGRCFVSSGGAPPLSTLAGRGGRAVTVQQAEASDQATAAVVREGAIVKKLVPLGVRVCSVKRIS
jgi:hypothetical protein